jgi:hypothetical protein
MALLAFSQGPNIELKQMSLHGIFKNLDSVLFLRPTASQASPANNRQQTTGNGSSVAGCEL